MANMAEEEGVPYRLLENDDELDQDEIPDENILRIMKRNNPNMYAVLNEEVNKVIRMGGAEKVKQNIEENKPQSFLLSERTAQEGEQV